MSTFTERIVPGTLFADISSSQMAAMELGISLGERLKTTFPEIGKLYKEGFTLSMLIERFNLTSFLGVKFKVAETAVYRALSGYDGSIKSVDVQTYKGLLTKEEIDFYGKEHNRISGVEIGRKHFEQKTGMFAMSNTEKAEARRKSIIACGNVPYSDEELAFIEELAQNPEYIKNGGKVKVFEIAFEVNLKFHNGQEIRKPSSITKVRLRRNKSHTSD